MLLLKRIGLIPALILCEAPVILSEAKDLPGNLANAQPMLHCSADYSLLGMTKTPLLSS